MFIFKLETATITKEINFDFKYQLALEITMSFKGNSQKAIKYFIPYQSELIEIFTSNQDKVIELFSNTFSKGINGYIIEQFESYDKYIGALADAVSDEDKPLAKCLSNAISIATLISMSNMAGLSLVNYVNRYLPQNKFNNTAIPDIGFVLFKTGKTMNSKVKFERFILFVDNSSKIDSEEIKEIFSRIYQAIRKFLTAGKLGENGMRLNPENSYYPPTDSLYDILKLIEGIITESNANDKLYYGIDCNANNYYTEEINQYEMDGFKKPPEIEQLIDFYIKLCSDHPSLRYMEDPLASKDIRGWSKLLTKFAEAKPNVKIVCKSMINESIGQLSELIDEKEKEEDNIPGKIKNTLDPNYRSRLINNVPRPEDVKEELTELEKRKIEEEERKKREAEEEAKRIAEEEEEKKRQEEMKKPGAKKQPEPPKPKKKTDEEIKKEKEEEEKALPPPLPLNIKNIALRLGNFKNLTELYDLGTKAKTKGIEISIYDNTNETEQSGIIDIGLSSRVSRIILNGFTIRNDKMEKMIKYIHTIDQLY